MMVIVITAPSLVLLLLGTMIRQRSELFETPILFLYVTERFLQSHYPTNGKQLGCSDVEIPQLDPQVLTKRLQKIGKNNDVLTLGTIGFLHIRWKGQQDVIKAMKSLKEKGFKFKDDLTDDAYAIKYLDKDEIKGISDEELKIMRNYPYAMAGYDFSDKKLKDYFSKFLWYVPTEKDVKLGEDDYEYVKDVDKVINDRKNGK